MSASELGSITRASLPWSPFCLEGVLELGDAVEVVGERVLVAADDHQDVVDAGGDRLFDDVLDRRLVDDGQHLFRHRLGGGEEAGAEPGCGDDGLDGGIGHELERTQAM